MRLKPSDPRGSFLVLISLLSNDRIYAHFLIGQGPNARIPAQGLLCVVLFSPVTRKKKKTEDMAFLHIVSSVTIFTFGFPFFYSAENKPTERHTEGMPLQGISEFDRRRGHVFHNLM
jgi:hypothetical protein